MIREPWTGRLRVGMPLVSTLILLNTLAVLTLAGLTVAATHFYAVNEGAGLKAAEDKLAQSRMRMRAQLIFFYTTIPTVLLIETISSNYSLWTDNLRPTYAAVASIFIPLLWILQIVLWSLCLFTRDFHSTDESAKYGYCPDVLQTGIYHVYSAQRVGTKEMAVWAVPSLLVLHAVAFVTAVMARRKEAVQIRQHEIECAERRLLLRPKSRVSSRSSTIPSLGSSMKDALTVPESLQIGQTSKSHKNNDQSINRLENGRLLDDVHL